MMRVDKRYAPKATVFANDGLHNIEQAVAALGPIANMKDAELVM